MKIKPLSDRIVIRKMDAEETTKGGLVLPDSAKEKPQRGEVIAVGPGRILDNGKRSSISVKKGDHVLFGKYSGTEINVKGEELSIMRESELIGKFE